MKAILKTARRVLRRDNDMKKDKPSIKSLPFQEDMKLEGISVLSDIGAVFVADTEFTVIHAGFRHAEDFSDLGAFPAAHVIFQHLFLFVRQVHGIHQCIRFAEVRLLMFKAIHRIHRQSLIICKIYVFDLLIPNE